MIIETFSEKETFTVGFQMGQSAVEGEVYALSGDLGAGKTAFAKGFAKGLAITDIINSPTFTILQIYESGRLPFYHFDVYRITDIDEMEEIGYEEYFYGHGVCLVEWADLIEDILPPDYKRITIEKNCKNSFDYRKIRIEGASDENISH